MKRTMRRLTMSAIVAILAAIAPHPKVDAFRLLGVSRSVPIRLRGGPQVPVPCHEDVVAIVATRTIDALRFTPTRLQQANGGDDTKLQETDKAFWLQQKQLIQDLSDVSNKSLRAKQKEQFARRRIALVGDTAFLSFFVFCGLWTAFDNPFVALSYILGATLGLAYAYGLGKYVENIGGSVYDAEAGKGAGVGEARFAFLILLFVLVGKFKSAGLMPVLTIAGFFTYQITSLSQGLKQELDDDE